MGSPLVWLALCVAFLAPFVDPRRPARLLHLDLIVLLAFGGYPMLFGGSLGGLPLAYPALAYVLARLLYVGLHPKEYDEPLLPRVRVRWLGAGLVLLIGVRIAINLH